MTSYNVAVAALREQAAAIDLALEAQMTDDYGNMVKEASGAIVGAATAMKRSSSSKKQCELARLRPAMPARGFDPRREAPTRAREATTRGSRC